MKRISLACALFVLVVASIGAQVHPLVPIVRPVLHEKTKIFILDLAESMDKDGYTDAASYLKAWAEGGFGSGFVVVDPKEGRNLVFTNRHVVAQAERVILEFENEDGSTVTYKDCPIIGVSESLDIAIIGFPEGVKPFAKGLSFGSALPTDGSDVLSAGFPGLLSRPSWQFGKGSVTNSRARIPELADPKLVELIQHSAPIDPGSSGGPLVAANKKVPFGYEVVGINTWKVGGRDVNFAIPAETAIAFMRETLTPRTASPREALAARVDAFVMAIHAPEDTYKELSRFISYELVSRTGERYLKAVLASAPTKVREDIVSVFIGASPVDGLRLATAYGISSELRAGSTIATRGPDGTSESEGKGLVELTRGAETIRTRWIIEHGYWRIETFPTAKSADAEAAGKKKSTGSGINVESPFDYGLTLGVSMELGSYGFVLGNLGISYALFNTHFLMLQGDFAVGSYTYTSNSYFDPGERKALVAAPKGSLVLQLPIKLGEFYIVPFVEPGAGFIISNGSDLSGLYTALGGGLYCKIPGTSLSIGAEFSGWSITRMDDLMSSSLTGPSSIPVASLYATVGFY